VAMLGTYPEGEEPVPLYDDIVSRRWDLDLRNRIY